MKTTVIDDTFVATDEGTTFVPKLTKIRKICYNEGTIQLFSNEEIDLVGYGTKTAGPDLICQNCGSKQND